MRKPLRHLTRLDVLKADVAVERRRLEKLRDKYSEVGYLRDVLDKATRDLEGVAFWSGGADPHFDTLKMLCATMAKATILDTPDKRLGARLRKVASWFYLFATGETVGDLERACRAVTPKRTNRTPKKRQPVQS